MMRATAMMRDGKIMAIGMNTQKMTMTKRNFHD